MENEKYIVYIDESNISAIKGNSVYCAVFIFHIDKDEIIKNIITIENKLNINYLHWVDMPWKLRIQFAEQIKYIKFMCEILMYKNPINQDIILESFIESIVSDNKDFVKIIIDGNKNSDYIRRLKNRLKNKGFGYLKLIFVDDKNEALIRLSDFIAGLVRSYSDSKNKHNSFMFNILKHKIKIPN